MLHGSLFFYDKIFLLPDGNTIIRLSPDWTGIYKVNCISFIKFPPFLLDKIIYSIFNQSTTKYPIYLCHHDEIVLMQAFYDMSPPNDVVVARIPTTNSFIHPA